MGVVSHAPNYFHFVFFFLFTPDAFSVSLILSATKPEPDHPKMNTSSRSTISAFYSAKFASGMRFVVTVAAKDWAQKFFRTEEAVVAFVMENAVGYIGSFDAAGKLSRVKL